MNTKKSAVLITGALGEVGHGLINQLSKEFEGQIVALDLNSPSAEDKVVLAKPNIEFIQGNILDEKLLVDISTKYDIDSIFHLAALLSTAAEKTPLRAHKVNVEGSLNLLTIAQEHSERTGKAVRFMFPSSIAVYGIKKEREDAFSQKELVVQEDDYLTPITMYGINKLYIEGLGNYFTKRAQNRKGRIDFRCLRYPGLLSAETVPTGGTSDFGPEMLHAAAQSLPYACFVPEKARIPFMAMTDAIKSLMCLWKVKAAKLSRTVYNVNAFSVSAADIAKKVQEHFPQAQISYKPNTLRTSIVESWPCDVDDARARRDWNWSADFDFDKAFDDYLVPGVKKRYQGLNEKKNNLVENF